MMLSSESQEHPIMAEEEKPISTPLATIRPINPLYQRRLQIQDHHRVITASLIAGIVGFSLGSAKAGKLEALRFRAENAHRLPKSEKGWYLYHKSKNYAVMLESVKQGVKYGGKLGICVGLFFVTEIIFDIKFNSKQDFRSTALTGLASGFVWSRIHGMSRQATGRMIMLGLKGGLAFGFTQDLIMWANGRKPSYLKLLSFSKENSEKP